MKRLFLQSNCWIIYAFFSLLITCDGFILNVGSQYRKVPDPFEFMRKFKGNGQTQFRGTQASVNINENGEIEANTAQLSGTLDTTMEGGVIEVDNNGVTETLDDESILVQSQGEGGTATVHISPHTDQHNNEYEQPMIIENESDVETQPTEVEEQPQEIQISARHSPGILCHYQVVSVFSYSRDYVVQPEQIVINYCNTLVASYALIDCDSYRIKAYSLEEEAIFLRLTERRNGALKVILELETIAFYENLEGLLTSEENMDTFVSSTVSFLLAFGFDGLQLPVIKPISNNVDENVDYSYAKQGYLALVQKLSYAFYEYEFILSVSLPRDPKFINMGYDIEQMINYVDWFQLMSLDYNNNENSGYLRHTAPLTAETYEDFAFVDFSVTFLLRDLNVPSYMVVMAVPLYGSSFILKDSNNRSFGAEYTDVGPAGPGSHIEGVLTISELCSLKNTNYLNDASIITDYDDVTELVEKVLYARIKQLGGIGILSVTMDDPTGNLCRFGPMPYTAIIFKSFNANNWWSCQNSVVSLADLIDPTTTNKYLG